MNNLEFFRYNADTCYRDSRGGMHILTPNDPVVDEFADYLRQRYVKAYDALAREYWLRKYDHKQQRFLIVDRFIRCNFSAIDNVNDIDNEGHFHFERIDCPMRGICPLENIVCNPTPDFGLGQRELEVAHLIFQGHSEAEIAQMLGKSPATIAGQRANAYRKLGVHEKADFIKIAITVNLFVNR